MPFPLPTTQGRRAQQLKTRPECWIRGLHEASTQGVEATSANLFRKECLGMQRSPKAMLPHPTNVDLPECDCHLPPMESDGRRSRPVESISKSYEKRGRLWSAGLTAAVRAFQNSRDSVLSSGFQMFLLRYRKRNLKDIDLILQCLGCIFSH